MHHYLSVVLLFASLSLGLRAEAREWGKELVFTSAHQATQPATAKITGLIQDHDESPLTDVSVLIERVGLEWRGWRVRSDDDGQFSIEVPTGEYRIVLEKYGFKRTEYTGIILKVGEVQRLSIKMEIGLCSHCDEILTANIPPVPTQDVSDIPQVLRQPRRKVRLDPLGSIQLPITYNAYREGSGVDYWYGYIEDAESRLRFQYTAGIVQSPFQSGSEQLVWEKQENLKKGVLHYGVKRNDKGEVAIAQVGWISFTMPIKKEGDLERFLEVVRTYEVGQCRDCDPAITVLPKKK